MSIYVEIFIEGPLEEVWRRTQQPDLHQKWDLRFTSIQYLPRPDRSQPQQFSYRTRIGFGLTIAGHGETSGSRTGPGGESTSALRFWSDDPKSLIREGSGYWKYIPVEGGVRFLTWYEYKTRFGFAGRLFDAALFRPLMGWATAWSFDRLRLWVQHGIDPALSIQRALAYAACRWCVAFVFFYHGLVPKLLMRDPAEVRMLMDGGVPQHLLQPVLIGFGLAEIAWALLIIFFWRARWPLLLSGAGMIAALIGVAISSPAYLTAAFNPVTLNLAVLVLCFAAWLLHEHQPSARRCLRAAPPKSST